MHYNSEDQLINEYFGNVFTRTGVFNGGTGNYDFQILQPEVNASFICNEGDLIRCNQRGVLVGLASKSVVIDNFINISGTDRYSVFRGFGQNLYPESDVPQDPCDYRNYLYDFEYPVKMSDIKAILQRPSAPIKFSRTDTINAGIQGTINQLNIASVIRQQGQFTIRSNEKL
jgi:hypothetical protein